MGLNQLAYRLMGFGMLSIVFCLGMTALVIFGAFLVDIFI